MMEAEEEARGMEGYVYQCGQHTSVCRQYQKCFGLGERVPRRHV